jgi:hypothetical protein
MQPSNGGQSALIFVLIAAAALLVRKGRLDPAAKDLERRQRIRPLELEWLDPLIVGAVVGPLLWHDLTKGLSYVGLGLLGAAVGLAIGALRARVMFVRALPQSRSVILTRSTAEYLLLGLLLVLKLSEDAVDRVHSPTFTLVLTALLAVAVVESLSRSIAITFKYRSELGSTVALPGSSRDSITGHRDDGQSA